MLRTVHLYIAYLTRQYNDVSVTTITCDNKGRILVLNVTIDARILTLKMTLTLKMSMLKFWAHFGIGITIGINENANLLLAGDFNVFFDTNI